MSSHADPHRPFQNPAKPSTGAVVQSRETGQLTPPSSNNASSVATRPGPSSKPWAHLVAGAVGGMNAALATNPLDVLKTRLQSDFYQAQLSSSRAARGIPALHTLSAPRTAALHIRETFQILFAIPRVEGWRALFKGLGPNLIGVVPARAINFYTYGNGKRIIAEWGNEGREAAWVHLCAAATAGVITGTATCPIWVVKTRMQLDRSQARQRAAGELAAGHQQQQLRRYRNALDCMMQTLRHEGIRGLYRGLGASYLGVSESTLQWVLYEQLKAGLARREAQIVESGRAKTAWDKTVEWTGKAGSAGFAKSIAAVITYPHEVVRTRLRQAPLQDGRVKYTGIIQCVRLVFREEGLVALYGGLVPHMLRVVPSAAIMFGSYEGILKLLGTDSGI